MTDASRRGSPQPPGRCASARCVINLHKSHLIFHSLGLARLLVTRFAALKDETTLAEAQVCRRVYISDGLIWLQTLYREVIAMAPGQHDAYIELGDILAKVRQSHHTWCCVIDACVERAHGGGGAVCVLPLSGDPGL